MTMAEDLTDDAIQTLLACPKKIVQSERRKLSSGNWRENSGSLRAEITVEADTNEKFTLFIRQAVDDIMDFSVGLRATFRDGSKTNIIRCNGLHGWHRNDLENTSFVDRYHVHIATERYIKNGSSAEKYAEPTDNYKSLESALEYILDQCNITYREDGLFR